MVIDIVLPQPRLGPHRPREVKVQYPITTPERRRQDGHDTRWQRAVAKIACVTKWVNAPIVLDEPLSRRDGVRRDACSSDVLVNGVISKGSPTWTTDTESHTFLEAAKPEREV